MARVDSFDEVGLFISIISRSIDELAASPIKICTSNVLGMQRRSSDLYTKTIHKISWQINGRNNFEGN